MGSEVPLYFAIGASTSFAIYFYTKYIRMRDFASKVLEGWHREVELHRETIRNFATKVISEIEKGG